MRAGKQRHRIWIDQPKAAQDASGGEVITWLPFAEIWASVEPLRGREQLLGAQTIALTDSRITFRWSPNLDQVTEKWRVRHGGIVYDITALSHVALGQREIELQCKSGANNG